MEAHADAGATRDLAGGTPRPRLCGRLVGLAEYPDLEADWMALEAGADGGPFTTWLWVSTWLRNLPAGVAPLVFSASDGAKPVALGLVVPAVERGIGRAFGSHSLHMQETGDGEIDEVTVEYTGLLALRGTERAAYAAFFDRLSRERYGWRRLRFAWTGHGSAIAAALPDSMQAVIVDAVPSHYVDLAAVRATGGDYVARLGPNSRSSLRQTVRAYRRLGPVRIDVAGDAATALEWLARLERLHTRYWRSKGRGGSFQSAFFGRFHRDLVARGTADGRVRMTRVTAGGREVGYLYNLWWRNRVYFYNSGLNYGLLDRHDRPGVLALHAAIEQAMEEGCDEFDFLAGDHGYKGRMATGSRQLCSIDVRRNNLSWACEKLLARLARRGGRTVGPVADRTREEGKA